MRSGNDPILRTDLAGIPLAAPVLLAAGTAGTLDEMGEVIELGRVGGVVTKSITRKPRIGNVPPRITWTRDGMLNAIGLANPGVVRFGLDHGPRIASMPCAVFVSVAGFAIGDYAEVVRRVAAIRGVRAIELNVSCPNAHGGSDFGADPGALRELIAEVKPLVGPAKLFVKLPPVVVGTPHTIVDLASVAVTRGVDGLVLCNTVPAMRIDVETRRPALKRVTGGLSGPALHAIVLKLVHETYRGVGRDARVPIVACGGVSRWEDAAAYILAGASAVQMGAATLAHPKSPLRVAKGLAKWAEGEGVESIGELVGGLRLD